MKNYKTVYTEVEVEVDLGDFDTQDLLDELDSRGSVAGIDHPTAKALLNSIWLNRRVGKDYQPELDNLIYHALGKTL